jgi:tetratricopeptide (TPR) repeat protein
MIGTLLAQRYRIDAVLGEGGMGVVYRAHDTVLDRLVAIKTLSPHLLGEEGLRRLLREAQAAAKLTHPHIVAVYDVLEDAGAPAIVMEYVEGKTLRELTPIPLDRLTGITDELLDALSFAHGRGIIHRDVKPENVLVNASGAAKVTDFGLARSEGRSRLTQAGMVVGTVAYMAPEQALGGVIDGRTDLYAVGCVLYEVVTGHRPFDSEDPISVISQHLNVPPVAPRWHNPELPPDWEGFILKLMAKDPAERYGSAEEARRALQALRPSALDEDEPAEGEAPAVAALLGTVRRGRLIARDVELRELKGYVDLAISGQGQMILVAGEPGIGKTRLSREAMVYARLRGARVLTGACYEQEATVPYLPFVEALRNYIRSRPQAEVRGEVGEAGPELIKVLPELAELIPGLQASPRLEAAQERLRLFDGISDFLVRLSRTAPILLFLDDLHWADGTSLNLLTHLARRLRSERILVLGTYRDVELDREHPLADVLREMNRERLYQRMLLRRLDREGVRALIGAMFSVEQVSDEFTDLIYRETEGNPFFLEEVLKHLVETGAMYREGGRWERKGIAEIEVPQSVKEVIGRRLEQVSDPCRQTLTLAAVIGRRFDFDVLVRTTDGGEDQTLDALEEAMRSQLLREEKVGNAVQYDFAHALIRETLYDGLSLRRRMTLHQKIAAAVEQTFAGRLDAVVEDLAHHYAQAPHGANLEKAIHYSVEAARKSMRLFAYEEAVKHYRMATELLEETRDEERQAEVFRAMGEPLVYLGRKDEAVAAYERALRFYEERNDRSGAGGVYRLIGRALQRLRDFSAAIPHLERALQTLDPSAQATEVVQTHLYLSRARSFVGEHEASKRHAQTALELASHLEADTLQAEAHASLGLEAHHEKDLDAAQRHYEEALRLAGRATDPDAYFTQIRTMQNLANLREERGDHEGGRRLRLEQYALARHQRDVEGIHRSALQLIFVSYYLDGDAQTARRYIREVQESGGGEPQSEVILREIDGDWEGALALLLEDLERRRETGEVQWIFAGSAWVARLLLDLNRLEEARTSAGEAAEIAERELHALLHPLMADVLEVLARAGEHERCARLAERAEQVARASGNRSGLRGALFGQGILALERGDVDRAVSRLQETLDHSQAHAARASTLWALARALARRGRKEDNELAHKSYAESVALFEKMEARRYAGLVRGEMAALPR